MIIVDGTENKEENNEIIIKNKKEEGKKKIIIFGYIFVDENKNNCKIKVKSMKLLIH